jgi:hypothetical protein
MLCTWVTSEVGVLTYHHYRNMFFNPYITTGGVFLPPGRSFLGCVKTIWNFMKWFYDFSWVCLGYKTTPKVLKNQYAFSQYGHRFPVIVTETVHFWILSWCLAEYYEIRTKQLSLSFSNIKLLF